jgi:hypothetical protein
MVDFEQWIRTDITPIGPLKTVSILATKLVLYSLKMNLPNLGDKATVWVYTIN